MNIWTSAINDNKFIDIIYFDFKKAFDKVSHRKILVKIKDNGISGNIYNWIESFLTNRKQSVKINYTYSKFKNILSGVPQSSVIGPIIFIIFINDLTNLFTDKIKIELFADDTKIHLQSKNLSDRNHMQIAINSFLSWSNSWQLDIASHKTAIMTLNSIDMPIYYIDNTVIDTSDTHKDLGIQFDKYLYFDKHILYCCRGALLTINNLFRCFLTYDITTLIKAYITYARPKVEFSTTLWNPGLKARRYNGLADKIERVQRVFTRRLFLRCGLAYISYSERLNYLGLQSLALRSLHKDLIMIYKLIHNICNIDLSNILNPLQTNSRTRGHGIKLVATKSRTNIHMNYLNNRILNVWNNLDYETVHSQSLNCFKSHIININFKNYL